VCLIIVQLSKKSTNYFHFFHYYRRPIDLEADNILLDGHFQRLVSIFIQKLPDINFTR